MRTSDPDIFAVGDAIEVKDYITGQLAYFATRVLLQNGFKVRNLAGGMMSRENLVTN